MDYTNHFGIYLYQCHLDYFEVPFYQDSRVLILEFVHLQNVIRASGIVFFIMFVKTHQ